MQTISFIGAGNVALRFSLALHEAGYRIETIYNRSENNMGKVVKALQRNGANAKSSFSISDTLASSIVIIAVSDNSIAQVVKELERELKESSLDRFPIFLHTSGATEIDVFAPLQQLGAKCGVLYPVMTLNKNKTWWEMATHSRILAQRIPWTEEPGRLDFTQLRRVGHN